MIQSKAPLPMDLLNFKCSTFIAHNQSFLLWQKTQNNSKLTNFGRFFILVKYLGISETHIKNICKAKQKLFCHVSNDNW